MGGVAEGVLRNAVVGGVWGGPAREVSKVMVLGRKCGWNLPATALTFPSSHMPRAKMTVMALQPVLFTTSFWASEIRESAWRARRGCG